MSDLNINASQLKHISSVQQMRFVAASLVLVGHSLHEAAEKFNLDAAFETSFEWGVGVDIFFVISGFIMFLTCQKYFGNVSYFKTFVKRRFERIVPLYWIFTTLMMVATLVFPGAVSHAGADYAHVVASYFFVPWPRGDGLLRPVLALGWTLNYEMFFYAIFATAFLVPRKIFIPYLTVFFVTTSLIHSIIPSNIWIANFWTNPIVLEFLAGVFIGRAYASKISIRPSFGILGISASIAAILLMKDLELERVIKAGVPAALFFSSCVFIRTENAKDLFGKATSFGGDISYAIYLSHPFSINIVAVVLMKSHLTNGWIFVGVSCVAALVGGGIVHLIVEKPLIDWFRERDLRRVGRGT